MRNALKIAVFAAVAMGTAVANAEPPDLQTPSPVIYLADNLDEAERLGWCIDTLGRGLSDQLQAHSCKPGGGDVQFSFDAESGEIKSVPFENLCASYDGTLPLGLLPCDDSPDQQFTYDAETMTISLAANPDNCLIVGATSRSAGPYMSRTLEISGCAATEDARKAWVISP